MNAIKQSHKLQLQACRPCRNSVGSTSDYLRDTAKGAVRRSAGTLAGVFSSSIARALGGLRQGQLGTRETPSEPHNRTPAIRREACPHGQSRAASAIARESRNENRPASGRPEAGKTAEVSDQSPRGDPVLLFKRRIVQRDGLTTSSEDDRGRIAGRFGDEAPSFVYGTSRWGQDPRPWQGHRCSGRATGWQDHLPASDPKRGGAAWHAYRAPAVRLVRRRTARRHAIGSSRHSERRVPPPVPGPDRQHDRHVVLRRDPSR